MDKIKVLLIDDDTFFGNLVTSGLTEEGFEVLYLNSLIAVSSAISRFCPNIILLDIEIGSDDGLSAIPEMQIVSHETPIIVLSSHVESEEINRALKMGAINYFSKPVNLETLPAFIKRAVQTGKSVSYSIGICKLNLNTRELFVHSESVKVLTRKEFSLLKLLILHKNALLTMEQIKEVWSDGTITDTDEHSVYNYIRRVRSLLSLDSSLSLEKVTGGYMLKEV